MTDHRYSDIFETHLRDKSEITKAEKWLEDRDLDLMIQLEMYQLKDQNVYPDRMFTDRLV